MNSDQQYLNLYFQVHQPRRLKKFQFFDVGTDCNYFDYGLNKDILCRIARDCYLPGNKLLLNLIDRYPEVKVTFSISGTALEQFERYAPEVLHSFRQLAETGSVEFLGETPRGAGRCGINGRRPQRPLDGPGCRSRRSSFRGNSD